MPFFRNVMFCVALVRTDVSEERSASIIRVTRIGELGMLAVTSNQCTVQRNTQYIPEYSILDRKVTFLYRVHSQAFYTRYIYIDTTELAMMKYYNQ
jgi:hypothetical protein